MIQIDSKSKKQLQKPEGLTCFPKCFRRMGGHPVTIGGYLRKLRLSDCIRFTFCQLPGQCSVSFTKIRDGVAYNGNGRQKIILFNIITVDISADPLKVRFGLFLDALKTFFKKPLIIG